MAGTDTRVAVEDKGTPVAVAVAVEAHRNRRMGAVEVGPVVVVVVVARKGNSLLIRTLTKNQTNRNRSEP